MERQITFEILNLLRTMDDYEKVIEKLIEFGELLHELVENSYKDGEHQMENIDKKVKLIANRIYGQSESEAFLKDCGYHHSLDTKTYVGAFSGVGHDYSSDDQRHFKNNMLRRINAIENLIEDYLVWGLPSGVKSEETEKGVKIGGKIFQYTWRKKTQN